MMKGKQSAKIFKVKKKSAKKAQSSSVVQAQSNNSTTTTIAMKDGDLFNSLFYLTKEQRTKILEECPQLKEALTAALPTIESTAKETEASLYRIPKYFKIVASGTIYLQHSGASDRRWCGVIKCDAGNLPYVITNGYKCEVALGKRFYLCEVTATDKHPPLPQYTVTDIATGIKSDKYGYPSSAWEDVVAKLVMQKILKKAPESIPGRIFFGFRSMKYSVAISKLTNYSRYTRHLQDLLNTPKRTKKPLAPRACVVKPVATQVPSHETLPTNSSITVDTAATPLQSTKKPKKRPYEERLYDEDSGAEPAQDTPPTSRKPRKTRRRNKDPSKEKQPSTQSKNQSDTDDHPTSEKKETRRHSSPSYGSDSSSDEAEREEGNRKKTPIVRRLEFGSEPAAPSPFKTKTEEEQQNEIKKRIERSRQHADLQAKRIEWWKSQGITATKSGVAHDILVTCNNVAIIEEIKSLDGSLKDERIQVRLALAQLADYNHQLVNKGKYQYVYQIVVFSHPIDADRTELLARNNIATCWYSNGNFEGTPEAKHICSEFIAKRLGTYILPQHQRTCGNAEPFSVDTPSVRITSVSSEEYNFAGSDDENEDQSDEDTMYELLEYEHEDEFTAQWYDEEDYDSEDEDILKDGDEEQISRL